MLGTRRYKVHLIPKASETLCMQEVRTLLVQENISKAVISGLVLARVLLACIAGAGLAGRAGTSAPPIKIRSWG